MSSALTLIPFNRSRAVKPGNIESAFRKARRIYLQNRSLFGETDPRTVECAKLTNAVRDLRTSRRFDD